MVLLTRTLVVTVKQGTPYKLIFTPLENIQNTSGLISFRVKEGVKQMEHKLNLTYNKEKKMKKLLILFSLLFLVGCMRDEDFSNWYP